jgi:GMP synthase (glutamine-hydrolysing)
MRVEDLEPDKFVREKVGEISAVVGTDCAINALSGGVDSSTVTMLGHSALGERLKTYFIENGLMREGEAEQVVSLFADLGVKVEVVDAKKQFFDALSSVTDPEEKREAITQTFYRDVFGKLVRESGAQFLLQGTILTDVDETVAGIKRQHNILTQLGIDTEREFGYKLIEPLVQLRKDGVREVAKALGLPTSVYNRAPFPGPALAARVIGEVTPERVAVVRKATVILEDELRDSGAFQCMAILHEDRVTGMREGKRDYGSYDVLERLSERITTEVPGVVSVTYNITNKPPSTMEVV